MAYLSRSTREERHRTASCGQRTTTRYGDGQTKARATASDAGRHDGFPDGASHPFYTGLNQLPCAHGFDDFAEVQCTTLSADIMGRPGLPPGIYFWLLLIGYFEGIDSERGVAWRAANSFALREFLGVGLEDAPPDHSTISRPRRLIHACDCSAAVRRLTAGPYSLRTRRGSSVGFQPIYMAAVNGFVT